jgi:hypothetical protein
MAFGVLSLLVVVAIIGVLAKKQLGSASGAAASPTTTQGVSTPTGTPKQQVDQVKQSVEGLMQQAPRQSTEDTK